MQKYEEETKETCQNGKKSVKTEKCLSKRETEFLIHFDFLIRYLYEVFI